MILLIATYYIVAKLWQVVTRLCPTSLEMWETEYSVGLCSSLFSIMQLMKGWAKSFEQGYQDYLYRAISITVLVIASR